MTDRIICSYNMSYASDLGLRVDKIIEDFKNATGFLFIPSETSFLKKQMDAGMKPRESWKNALKYLFRFIQDKKPSVIGLQELNRWYDYREDLRKSGYDITKDSLPNYIFGYEGTLYKSDKRPQKTTQRSFTEMNLNNRNAMSLGYKSTDGTTEWEIATSEKWDDPKGVEAIVNEIRNLDNYDYFHDEVYGTGNLKQRVLLEDLPQ